MSESICRSKQFSFDVTPYSASLLISRDALRAFRSQEDLKIQTYLAAKGLIIKCSKAVATQKLQNNTVVLFDEQYCSLWDHFKDVALPTFTRWFGWKVNKVKKEKKVTFKRLAVFPDIPTSFKTRIVYEELIEEAPWHEVDYKKD